ncbi:MAG: EF-hand domain-containing protein, partial [Pseudonocardiaceae bacterium]
GSPSEQQITEAYLRIWRDLHLPHLPGGSTAISKEQFLESTLTLATDPAAAQATVGAVAAAFLAIADIDHDGQVGLAEFRAFHSGHFPDLTEADANEAFAHLDTDGDDYLSAEEFTQAVVEYWSSNDLDAPGNWWMGRPVYRR